MARWMTPETQKKLIEMVGKGYPPVRIMCTLGITRSCLNGQLRKLHLKTHKVQWGLAKVYESLQGKRK
jgi:DNA-binding CsgD family transcriptional regulator